MKQTILTAVLAVLAALMGTGLVHAGPSSSEIAKPNQANSLIGGMWIGPRLEDKQVTPVFLFRDNGTMQVGVYDDQGKMVGSAEGTYELKNGTLTITLNGQVMVSTVRQINKDSVSITLVGGREEIYNRQPLPAVQ